MKRTLERELKVPEIAEGEANGTSFVAQDCCELIQAVAATLRVCGKSE